MSNLTNAQFAAQLAACNWNDDGAVSALITSRYTSLKIDEKVREKHFKCHEGHSYFANFFPTTTWQDGKGQEELRERYFHPRMQSSYQNFRRTMRICDPNNANECITDYCDIPEGGYGNLPQLEMYKWGLKTKRHCIANIRHIRDFMGWAKRNYENRFLVEKQNLKDFYTLAAIRMTGHKYALETIVNADGSRSPLPSTSPRNGLAGYGFSYMEPLFPRVHNHNNLVPLSMSVLNHFARRWTDFCSDMEIAKGPRGENIYEFWYPDDWYQQEVLDNPQHIENLRYYMPSKLFQGYSNAPGNREILGNWAMRTMPSLPRFSVDCNGQVVQVDEFVNVDVEIGSEPIPNPLWQQAPIFMAMAPTPKMGEIVVRPDLNTDAEGKPIMSITGNGPWKVRNDYEAECNPELNMPYSQKRFEMGFRLNDPDAGMAILFRAKRFRTAPINDCDLAPFFTVESPAPCHGPTIGCEDNGKYHQAGITQLDASKAVLCTHTACGPAVEGVSKYRLRLEWAANRPGFNQLDCECGSTIQVLVHDSVGDFDRVEDAVVFDIIEHSVSPQPYIYIEMPTLAAGECIKGIHCEDDTPLVAIVESFANHDADSTCAVYAGSKLFVDSLIPCTAGDNAEIEYFDADDVSLGTEALVIVSVDAARLIYLVTAGGGVITQPAGTVRSELVCL